MFIFNVILGIVNPSFKQMMHHCAIIAFVGCTRNGHVNHVQWLSESLIVKNRISSMEKKISDDVYFTTFTCERSIISA
jgi:hypothetical protein